MRLLLVEDELEQIRRIKPQLERDGYVVEQAHDGESALFWAQEEQFNLIILDLGLPKLSGLEVLESLRAAGNLVPVIILTGRDTWQEKVDGLKAGADDYLTKPYHPEELLARIEATLRRHRGRADNNLSVSGVKLDTDLQEATNSAGERITLTAKEYRLLRYLMLNAGRFISKSELSEQVYEEEQLKDSNVIEVYINRLRQAFGKQQIQSKRGQGYCWVLEPQSN